jgi:large subunit ribosomal protein L10
MNREEKAAVVEEIAGQLSAAEAVFAVDYRGISVTQAAELRAKLRDAGAVFRVVKNSLTERAAEKAGAESLKPLLEGPTALTLVEGDAALAAKALNDTARTLRLLEFKGGIMNGSALSADEIRAIARLPARDVLHGQLVGVVAAPLSGLARTLNALLAGVAVQLQQIAEQGLVGGASETSEPETGAEAAEAETPGRGASETSEPETPTPADVEAGADAGAQTSPAEEAEPAETPAAEAEAPIAEQPEPEPESQSESESESDEAPAEPGE